MMPRVAVGKEANWILARLTRRKLFRDFIEDFMPQVYPKNRKRQ
jgi:hypothetical protein